MTNADESDPTARIRRLEVEVPGTPEEVWRAIATGAGHAAWLFPADIEAGEGGAMMIHREPYGPDVATTVTAWEPPHRFAYDEPIQTPDSEVALPLTTEFIVEAKGGGSCVVRVVSGFYRDGEGWEDLVEGASEGWRMALTVLRAYLTYFAGQYATKLDATVNVGRTLADRGAVSAVLMRLLGLTGLAAGDPFRTLETAPFLAGTVEHASTGYVLLRADEPYPALFAISSFPMADGATVSVNVLARLYGAPDEISVREQETWNSWLADQRSVLGTSTIDHQ